MSMHHLPKSIRSVAGLPQNLSSAPLNRPLLPLPREHTRQTWRPAICAHAAAAGSVEPNLNWPERMWHAGMHVLQRAERGLDPHGPEPGRRGLDPGDRCQEFEGRSGAHGWQSSASSPLLPQMSACRRAAYFPKAQILNVAVAQSCLLECAPEIVTVKTSPLAHGRVFQRAFHTPRCASRGTASASTAMS